MHNLGPDFIFGFATLSDAFNWFYDRTANYQLADFGYFITCFPAADCFIYPGDKQLAFHPRTRARTFRLPLFTLFADQDKVLAVVDRILERKLTFDQTNSDPEQQAIIDTIRNEPAQSILADARAGAAKTSTIEMAAQEIDATQINSSAIALAFNKRIQEELLPRLPSWFECKTLNGLGHQAWYRARGKRLTLDSDKLFKSAKLIIPNEETKNDDELFVTVLGLARKAKSKGLVPVGAPPHASPVLSDKNDNWEDIGFELGLDLSDTAIYYARLLLLESIKQAYQGVIDFDDQIYMSVLFGGQYNKYHTVIVDEAQDLSPLNHRQLQKVVGTRLVAVGDPYQAIYAFRGADNNSMTNMMDLFGFKRLGLTYSFRVPHNVSARQVEHVPDFKSWPTVNAGNVEYWPTQPNPEVRNKPWSLSEIPRSGAILCRNNAPLMRLAFALIKARRPVKILGRDIGASLASLLERICEKADIPVDEALTLVDAWEQKELAKVANSESKQETVRDRASCLVVLLDASGAKTSKAAGQFIRDLFADKVNDDLVLSSGHRSKGLEWHWVMHLDPWRVPSKQAQRAEDAGNEGPMLQEKNLRYVIETRTKGTLVLANLDQCEEL